MFAPIYYWLIQGAAHPGKGLHRILERVEGKQRTCPASRSIYFTIQVISPFMVMVPHNYCLVDLGNEKLCCCRNIEWRYSEITL